MVLFILWFTLDTAMNLVFPEWSSKVCINPNRAFRKRFTQKTHKGLSQAAVHGATSTPILPPSLWKEPSSITKDIPNSTSNLLNILARIIADPEIAPTQGDQAMYQEIVKTYSSHILKHVNSWMIDVSTKEGLRKTLEEIAWFVSLIYAVPGYTNNKSEEDGTFNADFF